MRRTFGLACIISTIYIFDSAGIAFLKIPFPFLTLAYLGSMAEIHGIPMIYRRLRAMI